MYGTAQNFQDSIEVKHKCGIVSLNQLAKTRVFIYICRLVLKPSEVFKPQQSTAGVAVSEVVLRWQKGSGLEMTDWETSPVTNL